MGEHGNELFIRLVVLVLSEGITTKQNRIKSERAARASSCRPPYPPLSYVLVRLPSSRDENATHLPLGATKALNGRDRLGQETPHLVHPLRRPDITIGSSAAFSLVLWCDRRTSPLVCRSGA